MNSKLYEASFVTLAALLILLAAMPALAQPAQNDQVEQLEETMSDLFKQLEEGQFRTESGQHTLPEGTVVNIGGDVMIEADRTVRGDAVAFGGEVDVEGTVQGNVVSIGGSCRLSESARIRGDVMALGGSVQRHDQAVVEGSSLQIDAPWAQQLIEQIRQQAKRVAKDLKKPAPGKQIPQPPAKNIPAPEKAPRPGESADIVKFRKDVVVAQDEVINQNIFVFEGSVEVSGTVHGDIVVLDGVVNVRPWGQVVGSIFGVGRDVILQPGAHVTGDVVTMGGELQKGHGARIDGQGHMFGGETRRFDPNRTQGPFRQMGHRIPAAIAFLVLLVILVAAVPNQMDAVATRVSAEPGRAVLYGLIGLLLVVPVLVVMVLMVVTWVLIPLFLMAVGGLALVGMVGMTLVIGRKLAGWLRLSTESLIAMAVLGFIILTVAGMFADLPVVGAAGTIALLTVFTFGFGGALMTGFGADPSGTWLFGGRSCGPTEGTSQDPTPDTERQTQQSMDEPEYSPEETTSQQADHPPQPDAEEGSQGPEEFDSDASPEGEITEPPAEDNEADISDEDLSDPPESEPAD